jgi:hypothetical protein
MPSDCHDLARRIVDGLRLMADLIEDPTDMDDATEHVEQLPSKQPLDPPAAAPVDAAVPIADRQPVPHGIARISAARLLAIAGLSPQEFRTLASMSDDDFEKAQEVGFVSYLRGLAEAPKMLEAAE